MKDRPGIPALNHTQFDGANNTANFASPGSTAITNLPFNASGAVTNINGFGTVNLIGPYIQMKMEKTYDAD